MARDPRNPGPATDHRRAFLARVGLDYDGMLLVIPSHSANIEVVSTTPETLNRTVFLRWPTVTARFDRYRDGADGTVTAEADLSVAIVIGDCIPLMFWSRHSLVHGVIHVGLLGAINGIVFGLNRVAEYYGEPMSNFSFLIGPSLGPRDLDLNQSGLWGVVGAETRERVPRLLSFARPAGQALLLDLVPFLLEQLEGVGIDRGSVEIVSASTGPPAESDFFSHKSQLSAAHPERFLAVIGYQSCG